MKKETVVEDVRTSQTQGGNTRFVLRDSDGDEYTTFREAIGEAAQRAKGARAKLTFHEQQRGQYKNVYLDKVEAAGEHSAGAGVEDTDPEEAAWRTAVDAAPWLVGSEPDEEVPPEELYEKLKPFKDRVAEDIKSD